MTAILRDQKLGKFIEKDAAPPIPVNPTKPTPEEMKAIEIWKEGDYRAQSRIELSIGDAEMIHIMGASTASQMWKQLSLVKENRGEMGALMARRTFYRYDGEEGVTIVEHVSKLREMQEELHLMECLVEDKEFGMVLLMSLPGSWDVFTSSFVGSKAKGALPTSHEIIAILLEEERRRTKRTGNPQDIAMHGRFAKGERKKNSSDSDKECFNCHKKGHMAKDCWSKGGGKEGQGPKKKGKGRQDRTNQATDNINDSLDIAYMTTSSSDGRNTWVLDSATTSHISNNRRTFIDYQVLTNATVKGIGKEPASAAGRGTVMIEFNVDGKKFQHRMRDVLHVPEAPNCLLSVARFEESGGTVYFKKGKCYLHTKNDQLVGHGARRDRLYLMDAQAKVVQEYAQITRVGKSWNDWHRRFGHVGIGSLEIIAQKNLAEGFEVDTTIASRTCDACIQAKQTVRPFPQEAEGRSKIPGERIFSDVWGKARTRSLEGAEYFISFIDDATRMVTVMFMKVKSEAAGHIKQFVNEIERRFDRKTKYLRFDNGKELVNAEMKKWAAERGIIIETTAPYSPSQHGTAERMNRTLLELTRAMLIGAALPPSLWAEAVAHATYIRNRSPTRALGNGTPFEAWHGKRPDVRHFQEFGRDVWILRQGEKPSKLEPKSYRMKFVGFLDAKRAIRFYDPAKRSIRESRNFAFGDEDPRRDWRNRSPGFAIRGGG